MKKIFTLIAMAVMTVAANAQVVFVDPEGKEYANGETMTIHSVIDEEWGDVILHAPSVKNKGTESVNVSLGINVLDLPANTQVQMCYPSECRMIDEVGTLTTTAAAVAAGEVRTTATEWQCYDSELGDYAEGVCTIQFTAIVNGVNGDVVTVRFVNGEDTAVESISGNGLQVNANYDLQGRQTAATSGILIQKMSDGSVRKVLK